MSLRNRERRKWRCAGCGARMFPEVGRAGDAALAALRAANPAVPVERPDYEEANRLRPLTPAEMFALHFRRPNTLAAAERVTAPAGVRGTILLGKD